MVIQKKYWLWRILFVLFILAVAILIAYKLFMVYQISQKKNQKANLDRVIVDIERNIWFEKSDEEFVSYSNAKIITEWEDIANWSKIYTHLNNIKDDLQDELWTWSNYEFEMVVNQNNVSIDTVASSFNKLYGEYSLFDRLEEKSYIDTIDINSYFVNSDENIEFNLNLNIK